jgi:hypothetical protein
MKMNPYLKIFLSALSLSVSVHSFSQPSNDTIQTQEVKEILYYLASDELKGRVNFSEEQLTAASYIIDHFKKSGLQPFPGYNDFYLPFRTDGRTNIPAADVLKWNKKRLSSSAFVLLSPSLNTISKHLDDFKLIRSDSTMKDSTLFTYWQDSTNVLLWIKSEKELLPNNIILPKGRPASDILMVVDSQAPTSIKLSRRNDFVNSILYNVVGVLPGKSKPEEAILFSAHYDHVSTGIDGSSGGIFNGANDDASGTTAVMMLAKYYALKNDNERTLIFCAFAGEELGLLGSKVFSEEILPGSIVAGINIEMIGHYNAVGKNAIYITGEKFSSLATIMKNNFEGSGFEIKQEAALSKNLFMRSDNYSFVKKGIPAHSIMSSDDDDPCYHRPCDDAETIDVENMTAIIKAIIVGCKTIVSAEETPSRVDVKKFQ